MVSKSSQKTIKHNLLLSPALWADLAIAAAKSGKSRAQFIRGVLAAACIPKGVSESQIPMMKGHGYAQVPRAVAAPIVRPAPAPQPRSEPVQEPPDIDSYEEQMERERREFDPDKQYVIELGRLMSPSDAVKKVKEWCVWHDVHRDWDKSIDTSDSDDIVVQ